MVDTDSPEFRRKSLESYVSLFGAQDAAGLAALFADDAVIEDPVGKPARVGRESIEAFFTGAAARVRYAAAQAPVRGSHSRFAAVPLIFVTESDGVWQRVAAVDVMEFNTAGQIVHMRAFHGPEDREELSAEAAYAIING